MKALATSSNRTCLSMEAAPTPRVVSTMPEHAFAGGPGGTIGSELQRLPSCRFMGGCTATPVAQMWLDRPIRSIHLMDPPSPPSDGKTD